MPMTLMRATPARSAAIGEVDRTAPRLSRWAAAAVVLAAYLLFFGRGVVRGVQVDLTGEVLDPTDFGSVDGLLEVTARVGQLAGAVLILVLVCRWLVIGRELAGVPGRSAPAEPALVSVGVVAVGILVAGLLLQAVTVGDDPNAAAGGLVGNAWASLSLVGAVSAGVVEEIVIVAVPVLLGRRADLHPLLIIGVSGVLRWPFHAYHGLVASLPWALVWGSAYTVAYLYLRRLLPLILVHALYDAQIDMSVAYGDVGRLMVLGLGLLLVAGLAVRVVLERRRRRAADAAGLSTDVLRFMLVRADRFVLAAATVAVALVAVAMAVLIGQAPDLTTAVAAATAVGGFIAVVVCLGAAAWVTSNWTVRRDPAGKVTGVVRWHRDYLGENVLDSAVGMTDLAAAGQIAVLDDRNIVLANTRARRRLLTDHGIDYRTRGFLRRLCISPQDLRHLDTAPAPSAEPQR